MTISHLLRMNPGLSTVLVRARRIEVCEAVVIIFLQINVDMCSTSRIGMRERCAHRNYFRIDTLVSSFGAAIKFFLLLQTQS